MARDAAWDWQIGVFGHNEAEHLDGCIRSLRAAAGGRRVLATLILNGTRDESAAIAMRAAQACGLAMDVFRIAHADKSNAINRYLYDLRVPAKNTGCVDAYVTIGAGTLSAFEATLAARPEALAVTGIGLSGRSTPLANRETVDAGGVLRGQLYCLRGSFIDRMTQAGIRLPVGLYRGDGLLGSMAAHDLDALGQDWVAPRVAGVAQATFALRPLSVFSIRDMKRQFRRKIRQMRGKLETAAIRNIIYAGGYTALPADADAMIRSFLSRGGVVAVPLPDRLFMTLARRQVATARPPAREMLAPVLEATCRP